MNTVNVVTERDNYALTAKSVCMSFVKVGEWEIECNIFTIFILYTFMCLSIFQYFVLCLFFIRLNKITKHKTHVHCLIMKSTPLLEKDPFIHETKRVFYVEYLSLWSTAVLLCCKPRYIAGYCTVLKNDKISRICPYHMLTMVIQLFSDRKYIFSSSGRQQELRPSEYEHNDTVSITSVKY